MKRKKNILCTLRSTRLESAKGLLLCYAVCVILFLGFKLCAGLWVFYGFQNGRYAQRNLTLNDFEQYGVEQLDDMTMVNATDDTQLWITENIYNLYVSDMQNIQPLHPAVHSLCAVQMQHFMK